MSEAANVDRKEKTDERDMDVLDGIEEESPVRKPDSLRATLTKFLSGSRAAGRPRDPKQDRTRALVLLIGGIVGSVLLFIGVFSTPPKRLGEMDRDRAQPSLGRRDQAGATNQASVIPILNAQPQSDDAGQDRISAADVHNTSHRGEGDSQPEYAVNSAVDQQSSIRMDREPLYRRDGTTGTFTAYDSGVAASNTTLTRRPSDTIAPAAFTYGSSNPQLPLPGPPSTSSKSSIIFVRSSSGPTGEVLSASMGGMNVEHLPLLPSGSRLIARLESAVTSALKAPVVAAVEYNYERDGVILIPAGTKIIGELQQASINGYVGIGFHTLQMPDGRNEKIEALATDLQNEPLKGKVTGTNKGRKFATRALSGVGTIAAYVVGAGGTALGQPITGETLLRDRLAGNIALAGEQELTNAASSQNIVVTVPAQTRLYVVFRKAAVESSAPNALPASTRGTRAELPTAQELRELLDLKREINRMYETSNTTPYSTKQ